MHSRIPLPWSAEVRRFATAISRKISKIRWLKLHERFHDVGVLIRRKLFHPDRVSYARTYVQVPGKTGRCEQSGVETIRRGCYCFSHGSCTKVAVTIRETAQTYSHHECITRAKTRKCPELIVYIRNRGCDIVRKRDAVSAISYAFQITPWHIIQT